MKRFAFAFVIAAYAVFCLGRSYEASRPIEDASAACDYRDEVMAYDLGEKINYIMDVVDETDFWSECDSSAFCGYEENTIEWCDAVINEYWRVGL